ncbi:hypothetical protein SDRG_15726 [Saprolegnia diclina VS20]|uniref:RNI-like protein n=1 Tax=Saprolegnia diclina (strain VS20) TaxID=1156394 RepID=T0PZE0_SAPDV|nr:hypothetical protein SDRG_15726 [Saprolegnia diclina VS20]EQC26445.1 hypothetical protein SDRG_15726 [Saprolegnia diclina VS20]|eukprot:XP_008620130.1 hypothetical protein SDRG_15726 [Saprolegnia diclina VS20]
MLIGEMSTATADLNSYVVPWLGSGHARSFSIECTAIEDEADLARTLATTSSLRSLGIHDNQEFLDPFLELELPLHQLTQVELRTYSPEAVVPFLALLDLAKITSLAISSANDHADFFTLGRLPALRHLASSGGEMGDGLAEASTWPDLESMLFSAIDFTPTAFATVLSFLGHAQGLRKLTFQQCKLADGWLVSVTRTFVRLIGNGLGFASFNDVGLDDASLGHLAQTLREGRNTTPLTLDLTNNYNVTINGVRVLLQSLAQCTDVRVIVYAMDQQHKDEIQAFVATHRMACGFDAEHYTLYSPTSIM